MVFVLILYGFHLRFISRNISTYIKIKLSFEIKVYGNPYGNGNSFKNLKNLFSCKKFRFVDFQKMIILEDIASLDESNNKVFEYIKI